LHEGYQFALLELFVGCRRQPKLFLVDEGHQGVRSFGANHRLPEGYVLLDQVGRRLQEYEDESQGQAVLPLRS